MRLLRQVLNCLLALVFVVSQPGAGAQQTNTPIGDKWAVVIGISEFADPATPKLKYAAKDAKDFYDYLVDPKRGRFAKDHVRLLTNSDATKVNILDALGDQFLPYAALPDDLVVIYLSTHGSPAGSDIRGVNYIVAHDTQINRLFATGINLPDLLKTIKERVHTKRILLCLDTCYSGAGASDSGKGLMRTNVNGPEIAQGIGSLVIASSSPDQRSWESDALQNSYFTKYLIRALSKTDGMVNVKQAFDAMRDQVQADVLHDKGQLQTPTLSGQFQGPNLIIGVPPHVVRRAPAVAFMPPASVPPVKTANTTPTGNTASTGNTKPPESTVPAVPATNRSTQAAMAPPTAAPSAATLSKGLKALFMDEARLPHDAPAQSGGIPTFPDSVKRAASAVASKNGASAIVLKRTLLVGGSDVTDQVLGLLANPNSIPQVANSGPIALVDRNKVVQSFRSAQTAAAKLKEAEDRIKNLVADSNEKFDAMKKSGLSQVELKAAQIQMQAKIDAAVKAVQTDAQTWEAELEQKIDAAIRAEMGSRGLSVAMNSTGAFSGQDITNAVVQRLAANNLTSTGILTNSTTFGVIDRDLTIKASPTIKQAAADLKAEEDRVQALIADSNKQYEAAKASGKSTGELEQMHTSLQKKIDDEVSRLQRSAQMMEANLETDLDRAIHSAAQEKGVSVVFIKDLVLVGGVDITAATLKHIK
jgi:Skp family chaperone for outer membrane proteins